ncbi:MAG TPA: general stress protein [Actinoplanes sp.]|nr:general stress protein [Actinoplanes sp.]
MDILNGPRKAGDAARRGAHHDGGAAERTPPADEPVDARVGVAQRVIAVHRDHDAAWQTVQKLSDGGFPAHRATIVGRDLAVVERVTGQLSTADVTRRGALSGVVIGALTGWILGLVDLIAPTVPVAWLILNAAILGAVLGAATGLLAYAFTHGRRSVSTPSGITASHYDVQVDAELADRAVRVLQDKAAS